MPAAISQDRLDSAILDAALDPALWHDAVVMLTEMFPGTAVHMIAQDRDFEGSMPLSHHGYPPDAAQDYAAHFQFVNPLRSAWSKLPAGIVCNHAALIPESEWRASEFYMAGIGVL